MLRAVEKHISEILCFSTEPITSIERANFERNKYTLEIVGQLQRADSVEGDPSHDDQQGSFGAMQAKRHFAHHEAATELLQFLALVCLIILFFFPLFDVDR